MKQNVDTALAELTSLETDLETETKAWTHSHLNVLKPAVVQYEKDAKEFLDEAQQKLSGLALRELEIELGRIAAEIATLLNL
jgi:hypothetical protein